MEDLEKIENAPAEMVQVNKKDLTKLLESNHELQQTVIYTTDVILLFIDMIGGKVPQTKMEIMLLVGKLPSILEKLNNKEKVNYLQTAIEKIMQTGTNYITQSQLEQIKKLNLLPEKIDNAK